MNIFEKYRPLYAPEVEGATGGDMGGAPPMDGGSEPPERKVPINERPVDGPGSGRGAIRKSLEEAAETVRKRETKAPANNKGGYQSRAAEMRGDEPVQSLGDGATSQAENQAQEQVVEPPKEPVPEAWSKEAKAVWANVPPEARAAIAKREQDVANGVAAIKQRYSDIESVLGPREDLIRRHGHTPAQAVNQLFSWFDALALDPDRVRQGQPPIAFIHLAKSFGLDKLIEEATKGGQQQPQQGQQPAGAIPPEVQQYINSLESKLGQFSSVIDQRFGTLEQTLTQSRAEKTNEILAHWAQGKDHYNDVREMMAHLLQSGAVPPLEGGRADLDKAYEMAVYAIPEIRQKVLAQAEAKRIADENARKAAEAKAQQDQVNRARRAAGALGPGAPGSSVIEQPRGKGQRKSVRESINEAVNELSGN